MVKALGGLLLYVDIDSHFIKLQSYAGDTVVELGSPDVGLKAILK